MNKDRHTDTNNSSNMVEYRQFDSNNQHDGVVPLFTPTALSSSSSSSIFDSNTELLSSPFNRKEPLPEGYSPSPQSVVIGKGGHTRGRSRLRMIAAKFLEEYSKVNTKVEKSRIVSQIIEIVEASCPQGGAFVRFSNGRWWEVELNKAREKVGYVLRDLLHDKYRSSSSSKAAARKQRSLEKQQHATKQITKPTRSASLRSPLPPNIFPTAASSTTSSSVMGHDHVGLLSNIGGGGGGGIGQNDNMLAATSVQGLKSSHISRRNSAFSYLRSFGHQDDMLEPIPFTISSPPQQSTTTVAAATVMNDSSFYQPDNAFERLSSSMTQILEQQQQQYSGMTTFTSQHHQQQQQGATSNSNGDLFLEEDLDLGTSSSHSRIPVGEDLSSVFD